MFEIDTPMYFEAGSGVVTLREREGSLEVLIIRRSVKNDATFPKGHIENGESLQETAIREALEESGRIVVLKKFLGSEEYTWKDDISGAVMIRKIYWFLAESVREGDSHPKDGEGEIEASWVTVEEARNLLTYASSKEIFERAIKAYQAK